MANSSVSESGDSNQRAALYAEVDMALNIMRFASDASDPELAQYVHGKACESFRRVAKLSSQAPSEDMTQRALHALERRIKEFQAR